MDDGVGAKTEPKPKINGAILNPSKEYSFSLGNRDRQSLKSYQRRRLGTRAAKHAFTIFLLNTHTQG